ncbi:MAG: tRNA nucleotidyltransferase/poly(A) polymerase family protein [Leptospirales bacterium]
MRMRIGFKEFPFWYRLLLRLPKPHGGIAYLVGGWVRDLLFFGNPSKLEMDWSVPGNAVAWAREIAAEFRVPILFESPLGTARFVVEHEGVSIQFDLASCRTERYPSPGKIPVVFPATIEEDLARRDFSINALAVPISFPFKEHPLMDPLGGVQDLRDKKLRILHPDSFRDDPTRIFRLFRFEHRLGMSYSDETEKSLVMARNSGIFSTISRSRLWDELRNTISEEEPLSIVFEWISRSPWGSLLPSLRNTASRRLRLARWIHLRDIVPSLTPNGKYHQECLFLIPFMYGLPRREFHQASLLFGVPGRIRERIRLTLFEKDDRGVFRLFEARCTREESCWQEAERISLESAYLLSVRSPVERFGFWEKFFRMKGESVCRARRKRENSG